MFTDAEKHFDAILAQRRAMGRKTYGRGLTHTDAYDWNVMAMEEAIDLAQYLAAENLRLRDQIAKAQKALAPPEPVPERTTEPAKGFPSPTAGIGDIGDIYVTYTHAGKGR